MERWSFIDFIKLHKGKIIGVIIGLLFGILVLTVGFWKSLFILVCIAIGLWIGGSFDNREKFFKFLDKILPKGLK